MRILLIYPPPWKIPAPGENPDQFIDGPPEDWEKGHTFGGDEVTAPYGLISIAAQAKRAGHQVSALNLYPFAWSDITKIIQYVQMDLFGLSCFTSNRRGAIALCRLIKENHPNSWVVMGGPHATALPREILQHSEAIDGIVIGEGEETFMELVGNLEKGKPFGRIAGMAWRNGDGIEVGRQRKRIDHLDTLRSPYEYCEGYFLLTSRGCPGDCTFCGSPALWGKKVRFHSAPYILDVLETMVNQHKQKYINIMDDTFTANRKRLIEICAGIEKRGLNFLWSCQTRVDSLDEEILYKMRIAGCQFLGFGVESGAPEILRTINKRTTPEKTIAATEMAKKFGLTIRYFMMVGNRGETDDSMKASIDLIKEAKPNQFQFSNLNLFPGTREFELAEESGLIHKDMLFMQDCQSLAYTPKGGHNIDIKKTVKWINTHLGFNDFWDYSISDRKKILDRFPDLHVAHMDLGKAYFLSKRYSEAVDCFLRALELDYPMPELALNYIAAISFHRGDIHKALSQLSEAKKFGYHPVVEKNIKMLRIGMSEETIENEGLPDFETYHEFETNRSVKQPVGPSPITITNKDAGGKVSTFRPV